MGSSISALAGIRVETDADSPCWYLPNHIFDGDPPPLLLEVLPSPEQFVLVHPRLSGFFMWDLYQVLEHSSLLDEAIRATQNAVDSRPELRKDASLFFSLGSQLKERYMHKHHPDDLYRAYDAFHRAFMFTADGDPEQAERLFEAGTSALVCFKRMGRVEYLDDAITALRCSVDLSSEGDQALLSASHNYRKALLRRLKVDDMEQSIAVLRREVKLAPDIHPRLPEWINNLGLSLWLRFQRIGKLDDLGQCIVAYRRVVELTPDGHPDVQTRFSNLGSSLLERFQRIGLLDDLEQCIEAFSRALELTTDSDPDLPKRISNLAGSLEVRFERIGQLDDLEQSMVAHRRAVELTPDGHPDAPERICYLGSALLGRFWRIRQPDDLEQSIANLRRGMDLMPDDHPYLSRWINNLGLSLLSRFERIGQLDDLEQSITCLRRAVDLTPDSHPDLPLCTNSLGNSLWARFKRIGQLDDLEQSISAYRRGIELTPNNHPKLPMCIQNLGSALLLRFQRIGRLDDLEQSIVAYRRAVELTPDCHPDLPLWLSNLGSSLVLRFKRIGQLDDLEESISALHRGVEQMPDSHPDRPMCIHNLGGSLGLRFERIGRLDDLEQSIAAFRRAIELTPDGHPDVPKWICNLGTSLLVRFQRIGRLDDLEQSIIAYNRAVELTPDCHPDLPLWISSLGGSLKLRFKRIGHLVDLEQCILACRRAIELTPAGHPDLPGRINALGGSLGLRFERIGRVDDLEQCIVAYRRSMELTPDDHPDVRQRIGCLGYSLCLRFQRIGNLDDLEQCIIAYRRAVELTPAGHPDLPEQIDALGSSLGLRFERIGQLDDIEQSIIAFRRGIELTPGNHPELPMRISNLGSSLLLRFRHFGRLDDLEQSVSASRRAVELACEDPIAHSQFLVSLGIALMSLCRHYPMQSNFDEAVRSCMASATNTHAFPLDRLRAARICANLHSEHPAFSSVKALLLAHSQVIGVLPEIVWLGHDVRRRFTESGKIGELGNAAVSAAIAAASLEQAVEWLEAGRALIWSQVLSLRTPADELQKQHPELAETLRELQTQLQHSAPLSFEGYAEPFGDVPGLSINPAADHHRQLVIRYDSLMKQIRCCSGFEDFLRPRRLAALIPPVEFTNGPVIFLHTSSARCDALVIRPGGTITLIPLPDLSLERANRLRSLWIKQLEESIRKREPNTPGEPEEYPKLAADPESHPLRHSALIEDDDPLHHLPALMWEWIVSPVLEALNMLSPPSGIQLPHVTWCPTGPLTQLPLHTAGVYNDPHGPRTFNFIVSSYTPSLSALRRCYEGATKPKPSPNALIVTQPASIGHSPLPQTTVEGVCVANILRGSELTCTLLNHEEAPVGTIEGIIRQFQWVHLACHGLQHPGDATQSAFALYDGPLSLADLMRTASNDAELAFLSACQTATGDANNPEESVHLAAGMLAIGFKGVVATMWSIKDEDAPIVVEAYYKKLIEMRNSGAVGKGQTGAAYALHEAVGKLREEVGEENFGRWAPFVHFGV